MNGLDRACCLLLHTLGLKQNCERYSSGPNADQSKRRLCPWVKSSSSTEPPGIAIAGPINAARLSCKRVESTAEPKLPSGHGNNTYTQFLLFLGLLKGIPDQGLKRGVDWASQEGSTLGSAKPRPVEQSKAVGPLPQGELQGDSPQCLALETPNPDFGTTWEDASKL